MKDPCQELLLKDPEDELFLQDPEEELLVQDHEEELLLKYILLMPVPDRYSSDSSSSSDEACSPDEACLVCFDPSCAAIAAGVLRARNFGPGLSRARDFPGVGEASGSLGESKFRAGTAGARSPALEALGEPAFPARSRRLGSRLLT